MSIDHETKSRPKTPKKKKVRKIPKTNFRRYAGMLAKNAVTR